MAILEIVADTTIVTYECGDAGYGVALEVAPIAPGNDFEHEWVGLWFGNRLLGEFPRGEEFDDPGLRQTVIADKTYQSIQKSISEVGEANHWSTVTLNGNTIWISEALRKAREELRKARAEAKKAEKEAAKKAEKAEKKTEEKVEAEDVVEKSET